MPNKTKRGVEYLQTHFPSTFCNIIGSNEKMKVCTGLQNTLLQENEVLLHTSSKKPIAAVNSKYNRIFSFDCEIAFKYNKKLYYCKSCKGLEYHLNELKKDVSTLKFAFRNGVIWSKNCFYKVCI